VGSCASPEKVRGAAEKELQFAQFDKRQEQRQVGQRDAAQSEIFQFGEAANAVQIGLTSDQKQPFQEGPAFKEAQRVFLFCLSKRQLPEPRHIG